MTLKWYKLSDAGKFDQPVLTLDANEHGAAIAEWGIFRLCIFQRGKQTKDGTRNYRAEMAVPQANSHYTLLVNTCGYLADAIKATEDLLFSKEYDFPANAIQSNPSREEVKPETRHIDGMTYRIKVYGSDCRGMLVEVSGTKYYNEAEDALARFCAKLAMDGYIITSVTEVHTADNATPKVSVLTSKAYKDELKRLRNGGAV